MTELSFQFTAEDCDTLSVEDMGEGELVLSQRNPSGNVERIAINRDQLLAVLDATAPRYKIAKNTDQSVLGLATV